MIQEEAKTFKISYEEMTYRQIVELGKRMDSFERLMDNRFVDMQKRIDRIEQRLDKQQDKIEKLADKIDRLANKIDAAQSHGQIATISSVGVGVSAVSITLGVLYSLFR